MINSHKCYEKATVNDFCEMNAQPWHSVSGLGQKYSLKLSFSDFVFERWVWVFSSVFSSEFCIWFVYDNISGIKYLFEKLRKLIFCLGITGIKKILVFY